MRRWTCAPRSVLVDVDVVLAALLWVLTIRHDTTRSLSSCFIPPSPTPAISSYDMYIPHTHPPFHLLHLHPCIVSLYHALHHTVTRPPLHFRFSCTPAARSYRNRIPVASHAHTPRLLLLHISVSISISLILCGPPSLNCHECRIPHNCRITIHPSSSPLTAHDCNVPVRPLVSLVLVFFSLSSFLSEYLWFGCIYATHRQLVSILGSLLVPSLPLLLSRPRLPFLSLAKSMYHHAYQRRSPVSVVVTHRYSLPIGLYISPLVRVRPPRAHAPCHSRSELSPVESSRRAEYEVRTMHMLLRLGSRRLRLTQILLSY